MHWNINEVLNVLSVYIEGILGTIPYSDTQHPTWPHMALIHWFTQRDRQETHLANSAASSSGEVVFALAFAIVYTVI